MDRHHSVVLMPCSYSHFFLGVRELLLVKDYVFDLDHLASNS